MRALMQDEPLGLHLVLDRAERLFADRAVVCMAGPAPRETDYRQVFQTARRLSSALADLGLRPGDRAGTFAWNSLEHLVGYIALPGSGLVMHTVNIRLSPEEIAYTIEHAGDRLMLVDADLWDRWRSVPLPACVEHVVVMGARTVPEEAYGTARVHTLDALLAAEARRGPWYRPEDERDAAGICYTSGTTGRPKAVVYGHRSVYVHALTLCGVDTFAIGHHDVVMPVVPMFHANSWNLPYAALLAGAGLALPGRDTGPEALTSCVERAGVTFSAAVPTVWTSLLSAVRAGAVDRDRLAGLDRVVIGGSAAAESLVDGLEELGMRAVHAWGMTESSPVGLVAGPPVTSDAAHRDAARLTQGRPMPGLETRLDDEGELQISGPYVAAAYLRPAGDDNDTRFADDPGGRRWLRTGDVADVTPDGYVRLVDRVKDLVKSGGEWISSIDVENHLLAHPAVEEAAVIAVPDEKWGERPLAVVVTRDDAATEADLVAFLRTRMPRWQVPDRVVRADELPKTSVGKLDKKKLRAAYNAGKQ